MMLISISTRTDAHNAVLNSGHRDRFSNKAEFDRTVDAVWLAARNGQISTDLFDEICNAVVG